LDCRPGCALLSNITMAMPAETIRHTSLSGSGPIAAATSRHLFADLQSLTLPLPPGSVL
jgi:hypothetical protein